MSERLRSIRKALLPPIDPGKLRFRGGWFALPIYLVVVSMYPLSLQHADWVEISEHFWWIAITGVLVGTLLGNGRMRFRAGDPRGLDACVTSPPSNRSDASGSNRDRSRCDRPIRLGRPVHRDSSRIGLAQKLPTSTDLAR